MSLVYISRLVRSPRSSPFSQVKILPTSPTAVFHPQPPIRQYYGRVFKNIVSKHITSIADVVSPVLPPGIASLPKELDKFARIIRPPQTREAPYASQATSVEQPEPPEDDISTEPYSHSAIDTDIQTEVRKCMRLVPHPVAIITATQPNNHGESAFRGMTVSSFNTVTLYPDPIVSFNVKLPSETYDAIRSSHRFLVHLLSSHSTAANLAREFSRGHENVLMEDKKHTFRFTSPVSADQQPEVVKGEPPRLSLRRQNTDYPESSEKEPEQSFPFILECRYHPSSAKVGDHVIVLGTVVKIHREETQTQQQSSTILHLADELCLTYADTRFWKMGEYFQK